MEALTEILKNQNELLAAMRAQISELSNNKMKSEVHVPWPPPLSITGETSAAFKTFEDGWANYMAATGMEKWGPERESQKASLLLSAIGAAGNNKYLFDVDDATKRSAKELIEVLRDRMVKKRNVIYNRFMFNSRIQKENERFDAFLLDLQKLISTCEYKEFEQQLLRDRIVVGIMDNNLKKELLKAEKLDLTLAIDMCRTAEATSDQLLALQSQENEIHKVSMSNSTKVCKFCGETHVFNKKKCPAYGKQCQNCGAYNHNKRVCKKKSKKYIKEIEDSFTSDEEDLHIGKVVRSKRSGSVHGEMHVEVNNILKPYLFQLDTGAQMCLIGYEACKKILETNKPKMIPSKSRLSTIGGHALKVMGDIYLLCVINNQRYKIRFSVVDFDHGPLLSEKACYKLGFIKYCKGLYRTPKEEIDRREADNIIKKYEDVFQGYGKFSGDATIEIDKTVPPSIQAARRVPMALREVLKDELLRLEKEDIITQETEHTEWVNNILVVKRDNKFRICLDPIPLNKAIKRPNYQFTTLDEILPELGKAKVFSTVDTKKGFWHVNLTEESSKLTTFWTPFGRYRWKRLPFGISAAPEIFQQKLTSLLSGLSGVEVMADDILIYGVGENMTEATKDHNRNLENLLIRLREANCKLNKDKLNLLQKSVKFFGHILTDHGLEPDESKVAAIRNMPTPTSKKEVLCFLGMITYLSRYIKNLSYEAKNLRQLTYKDAIWKWSDAEEAEFQKLKDIISDLKSLKYFEMNKPITMECDASSEGLGVVIYQEKQVIAYASRTLTKTEKRYAQIEKEMLAVVFGCTRFDQYINGCHKTIVKTDHKPLINIFGKPLSQAPKRLQLMLMTLQRYNIDLEYVKGKNNNVADMLSRSPIPHSQDKNYMDNIEKVSEEYKIFKTIQNVKETKYLKVSDKIIEEIQEATTADNNLKLLTEYIIKGFPKYENSMPPELKQYFKYKHELSTDSGIVFRNGKMLIPESLRQYVTKNIHQSHNGVVNSLRVARHNVFWPGMTKEIINHVESCATCLKHSYCQRPMPMISIEIPEYPFQIISMDAFEIRSGNTIRRYLITVDHYSDFYELDALSDLSAHNVITICKKNFARYGVPQKVITDGATNFVNHEFKKFAEAWKFHHVTSSPHYPKSNGKAEITVKKAKQLLLKTAEDKEDFWYALLHQRNIPSANLEKSPAQKFFCRRTRSGMPLLVSQLKPQVVQNVTNYIKQKQTDSKRYYDRKTQALPPLIENQSVFVKLQPEMDNKWYPGKIVRRVTERSYIVQVDGRLYRRNRIFIKPFKDRVDPILEPDRATSVPGTAITIEARESPIPPTSSLEPVENPAGALSVGAPAGNSTQSAEQAPINPPAQRSRRHVQRPKWHEDYFF